MPFPALDIHRIAFRCGQVTIIGGPPGGGKSAILLNYIIAPAVRASVPLLYYSPDSDIMTIGPRLIAALSDIETRSIFRDFDAKAARYDEHMELAKQLKHVQWAFQASPTYEDIEEELTAYEAVHGYFPKLIVLDNIRDVYSTSEGEDWSRQAGTVDYFHGLARQTNAAVVLLHHLTGAYEDGDKEPGLSALTGKIGKQARLVLNLWSPTQNELGIFVAKNSNGPSKLSIDLEWDREKQIIR